MKKYKSFFSILILFLCILNSCYKRDKGCFGDPDEIYQSLKDWQLARKIAQVIRDQILLPKEETVGGIFSRKDLVRSEIWTHYGENQVFEIYLPSLIEEAKSRGYKVKINLPLLEIKTKWHTYRIEFRWLGKDCRLEQKDNFLIITFTNIENPSFGAHYTLKMYDERNKVYDGWLYLEQYPCSVEMVEDVKNNFYKDQEDLKVFMGEKK